MDADEYRRMATNSDQHWWYRSTRALLRQLIEPQMRPQPDDLFLDAAGGTGATGAWLHEYAPTVLADYESIALQIARDAEPRYRAVRADLNHLPFANGSFSLVLCVTALYHRLNPDPGAVVRDYARIVRPGGLVCLMEPANKRLWRSHDEITHAARRFSLTELRATADDAGLEIVKATYAYSFLTPPAFIMGWLDRRGRAGGSDVDRNQSGLGGLFGLLASLERRILRRINMPFGLSAIVIARKPL